MRAWTRFASVILAAAVSACGAAGGVGPTPPGPQAAGAAAKTTKATFTIKWTNPSAPASVRRKDTISPSAQSVIISINGTQNTIANRNTQPMQSIVLNAPVGTDQFLFNVYDLPNGTGHLLGTATVSQLIVDGAANQVTAVIQAVCTATNVVSAGDDPLDTVTYTPPTTLASTLASIVVVGQTAATLVVGPEDADGNVIISQTTGQVTEQITGSATVTQVDGAHIQLTPLGGPRTTTPDTLTVAAPGCPSTTVNVTHSPAIYMDAASGYVFVIDWFGNYNYEAQLQSGDVLVGYDTRTKRLIAYNSASGAVTAYSQFATNPAPLYSISPGSVVSWSNYLDSVFAAVHYAGGTEYYTEISGGGTQYSSYTTPGSPVAITASPDRGYAYAFATNGSGIYQFNLSGSGLPISTSQALPSSALSLASNDKTTDVYAFNSGSPYVTAMYYSLGSTTYNNNYGFTSPGAFGATDVDANNLYEFLSNGTIQCSTLGGAAINIFPYTVDSAAGLVVVSSNQY